jgi:hypothetical protein
MGFDLWQTLGVSPQAGLVAVGAALVVAALWALRLFWSNRGGGRAARGMGLTTPDER